MLIQYYMLEFRDPLHQQMLQPAMLDVLGTGHDPSVA